MSFGERMSALLRKKHMTQKQLAKLIDTTEVSISRYVNNNRVPKGDMIAKIASALDTTSDFLLNDESITLTLPKGSKSDNLDIKFKEDFPLSSLSEDEKQLLQNYSQLNWEMKKVLLTMSNALVQDAKKNEEIS